MSVTVVLPDPLKALAGGRSTVGLDGAPANLEEAFGALRRRHPAVYDRVLTEQRQLRPHVNVFVDGEDVRWSGGLATILTEASEVVILPSVSGG